MPPKKIYHERIRRGLCTNCGVRKPVSKLKQCKECFEKKRSYAAKYYRNNLESESKRHKNKRENWRKTGRCVCCGRTLMDFDNGVSCTICKEWRYNRWN